MTSRLRRISIVFLCTAILATTSANALATTLLRMSLSKMSQTAKVIARARCVGSSASWDAGEIWTFASFDTEETWRGSPPSRFTVRLIGGRIGNLTSSVSGVPRFSPGEDVILFLEPTRRGDFSVVGWEQGTFRIRRDPQTGEASVSQDTASFGTFDPVTRQFEVEGIRRMSLTAFRARIAALLSGGTGREQ
jgi:hypothetical protein